MTRKGNWGRQDQRRERRPDGPPETDNCELVAGRCSPSYRPKARCFQVAGPLKLNAVPAQEFPRPPPNGRNAPFTTRGEDGRLKDESFRKDQTVKKKTFDAVAFVRKRREELPVRMPV
jgi:hypothetical protein